jgi:hypothetical protein
MSLRHLPVALDLVAVACETGQSATTQIAQLLIPVFGTFNAWRLLRDLEAAAIIVITPTRKVVWTPMGRKLHADIEQVLATVEAARKLAEELFHRGVALSREVNDEEVES